MTLQGYQFDKAKVTPESDATLYSYLAQSSDNKVISGLVATATGLNVYVAVGKALIQGRLVENGQQAQLTAQANKTGYVCITIDLTQDNTSTGTPGTSDYLPVNNQLRLELVEVLNQQDLNSGGLIYTFPLYSYVSTGGTVTLTKIVASYRGYEWTNIPLIAGYTAGNGQMPQVRKIKTTEGLTRVEYRGAIGVASGNLPTAQVTVGKIPSAFLPLDTVLRQGSDNTGRGGRVAFLTTGDIMILAPNNSVYVYIDSVFYYQ